MTYAINSMGLTNYQGVLIYNLDCLVSSFINLLPYFVVIELTFVGL